SVTPAGAAWLAITTRTVNGYSAPFIEFNSQAGMTTNGEVRISAVDGSVFSFKAVDLYSSTIGIPYQITGLRNTSPLFSTTDTSPNPFGTFRTVTNPNGASVIDTVSIVLTNAASGVSNPMGLTNIVLTR